MEIMDFLPEEELVNEMHKTTMLTNKNIFPYKKSDIKIQEMSLEDIRPTQLYVLKDHLEFQRDLHNELLEYGYNTLRLIGSLTLKNLENIQGMLPPIVEEDEEYGPCLLDGTHRAYLARQLGFKAINVIMISRVSREVPMIALPNEWDEITEYDVMPDTAIKKRRRQLPGPKYDYYRDFSHITNIGKDQRSAMKVGV